MSGKLSEAARMSQNLADLCMGRIPRWGVNWEADVDFTPGQHTPASPNQRTGANGLELLRLFDSRKHAEAYKALDWWTWLATQKFMQNEPHCAEPVYRTLHAYPHQVAYGVAAALGHDDAMRAAMVLLRSHFFWLLAGRGRSNSREVVDHLHGARNGGVLVGRSKPKFNAIGVACAGSRSWVRAGKNINSDFQFTDNTAIRVIVAQGLGEGYPAKVEWVQRDIALGCSRRWGLPLFALGGEQLALAKGLASNPLNVALASEVADYLLPGMADYSIDRYDDGSVVTAMLSTVPSSTDHRMIDACFPNGEIQQASCSDGIRSTKEKQIVIEESNAYVARLVDRPHVEVRVTKPRGKCVYSYKVRSGQVVFFSGSSGEIIVPPTPPGAVPDPINPSPSRGRRWYEVS